MKRIFCIWLLFCISVCGTAAAGLPAKPLLRIESGMHTLMINALATDAAEKLLVTGSDDKTVRIWNLPQRKLLQTLHMPQDYARDGQVYAVALSADGRTVAVGGFLGDLGKGGHSIYLLNPRSGWLKSRISGLGNVVLALAFSPDGHHLAAALGDGGVRVYDSRDWHLEMEDRNYSAPVYSLCFDRRGRLVTGCDDGLIRLYSPNWKLRKKVAAPGGKLLYSTVFSPDGSRIAVGYRDTLAVDVISADDLSSLYNVDTSRLGNGNLGRVVWSADGKRLYAAGTYSRKGLYPVVVWEEGGRGRRTVFGGGLTNSIMSLLPLKSGSVVAGSSCPSWVELSPQGKVSAEVKSAVRDFRGDRRGFRVSADGSSFSFVPSAGGQPQLAFSLRTMTMKATGKLFEPKTRVPGFVVTDWLNSTTPRINGRVVDFTAWKRCRSVAVAADGDAALFGTELALLLLNSDGTVRWEKQTEGIVWGVNLSADGRFAVAALSDGTVRWFRVADGSEVFALFAHLDGKRWVLWSPSGYYAASAGGAELIGWHLNHGRTKMPDFFPSSRFRSVFYRPDMVQKLVDTPDVSKALALADRDKGKSHSSPAKVEKILPPVVRLISPVADSSFSSPEVTLHYRLRTPSGEPVTKIKVLLDGRPLMQQENLVCHEGGGPWQLTLTLPGRDCRLSLIAGNRHTSSEPVTVQLHWTGKTEKTEPFVIKPRLYILAVGISDYDKKQLTLDFPGKDARDFVAAFKRQEGLLYRKVDVRLLTDATAAKKSVMAGLDWLEHEVTSNDVSAVYLAGHGVEDRNRHYYFLPRDGDPKRLRSTGVPYSVLKGVISNLPGKVLFFVDTCHAGKVMGKRRGVGDQVDMTAVANDLAAAENGVVVFASSTGSQNSLEDARWNNGAFTRALVEGLNGAADYSGDRRISIGEMNLFVSERVKSLTGGQQTPTTSIPATIPDFPIAVKID